MISDWFTQTIYIEEYTATTNSYGESIKTWTTKATVYGFIVSISKTETYNGDRVQGENRYILTCESRELTKANRVKYNNEYYNVIEVKTEPRSPQISEDFTRATVEKIEGQNAGKL
jgi:SPP1 family predicted phage head-tail adaptor